MMSAGLVATALLVAAVGAPLLAAPLVPWSKRPLAILPWAALPGLAAALVVPVGTRVELSALVIGISFELDRTGAVFLGFGSLLWLLAGIYATGYLMRSLRLRSFVVFWLLTMSGTLGTFVANDVATFYVAFAIMSLAAYGLVVHDRTPAARRAGRIYIILAVLGETAMLASLMIASTHAESLQFADVSLALTTGPGGDLALLGLIVALGLKAGLAPLHVWLPLAHPQAPTPASAVLSGVIVKAGIIGLIRLLPLDAAPAWGDALIVVGLVTAYYGVICGLMQRDAKAMLAYSTLSQMGLVAALLGSAIGVVDPIRNLDAAVLYATHHGLAKGALFLAIGVLAAGGSRQFRTVAMAVTAFAAFAIAGLPFSGGAVAKLAIKTPMGTGISALLVTVSAVGTALLMMRFLWTVAKPPSDPLPRGPSWRLTVSWAAAAVAALLVPAYLFADLAGYTFGVLASPANVRDAGWPILVAMALALAARRLWPGAAPMVPQGDVVVIGEAVAGRVRTAFDRATAALDRAPRVRNQVSARFMLTAAEAVERRLQRWSVSGFVLLLLVMLVALALRH
jgi:hydrogenase-4 component B